MSCAVRFKLGGWWRNSLIWRILVWMAGILGKAGEKIFGPLWRGIREAVGNIAVQWKLGAVFVLVVMVNLFAEASWDGRAADFSYFWEFYLISRYFWWLWPSA